MVGRLGYARIEEAPQVQTREDLESGGVLLVTGDGQSRLRVWTTSFDEDLYAPTKRGRAYRFSHLRVAQRVLLASGERVGLFTNGVQILLLISDPARPDSTVSFPLDTGWKRSRDVPDSYRFLLAIASPGGVQALPEIVDKARLQQARVTKDLRKQAREAVEGFVQEVLDHPENREPLAEFTDRQRVGPAALARGAGHRLSLAVHPQAGVERQSGAVLLVRLDKPLAQLVLAQHRPGRLRAAGARTRAPRPAGCWNRGCVRCSGCLKRASQCSELHVKPLGGVLFGKVTTPLLSRLRWSERAVAWLLDRLLWTPKKRGADTRERVHYGPLDVEDLGRVYEALLELEPGISGEPMCRLRRQKLEVVVPSAQGERYRPARPTDTVETEEDADTDESETEDEPDDEPARGKKTKVEWVEAILPGRFYLRVGLGRKATARSTRPTRSCGSWCGRRSVPRWPSAVPSTTRSRSRSSSSRCSTRRWAADTFWSKLAGSWARSSTRPAACATSGHPRPSGAAETGEDAEARLRAAEDAQRLRQRVVDLPDPDDELLRYLPSRSPEREESGLSQQRAEALCRRLVATHCLYGVDKNPLAVELAKLALWLESHAEGMPLTFLDHRLVVGDSLTGPFWDKLLFHPGDPKKPIAGLFEKDLYKNFARMLGQALQHVRRLEATVGIDLGDIHDKEAAKAELDRALLPFRVVAAAWAGGVMLGPKKCDDEAYIELLKTVGATGILPERIESDRLRAMIGRGLGVGDVPQEREAIIEIVTSGACIPALPYDLTFPEVFYPMGIPQGRQGFHVVVGNPPWDRVRPLKKEYLCFLRL